MNKFLAISLFLFGALWCQQSFGQLFDQRRNLSVGFNGGINMSSMDLTPKVKQNGLLGNSFGLTVRYMSEKYFKMMCGIQAEVNYTQKGLDEKFDEGVDKKYSRTFNYIEVPLFAHLAFGKDSNTKGMKFFLNMGPSLSFLLNENTSMGGTWTTSGDESTSSSETGALYDLKAQKKFEYGILGGAGLELSTKIGHFLLEGRYYFGLSDVFNSSPGDPFSRSANMYYGARLSYLFDLTR